MISRIDPSTILERKIKLALKIILTLISNLSSIYNSPTKGTIIYYFHDCYLKKAATQPWTSLFRDKIIFETFLMPRSLMEIKKKYIFGED